MYNSNMNPDLKKLLIGLFVACMAITTSSMGIQYYNKCQKLQDDSSMRLNSIFLKSLLTFAILGLGYTVAMYMSSRKKIKGNIGTTTPTLSSNMVVTKNGIGNNTLPPGSRV